MQKITRSCIKSLIPSFTASYSSTLGPNQKIIMLCGAPGVGKGTYSRLLAEDFGYNKISTGDEIRKILGGANDTGLSPKIISQLTKHVNSGKLVPDEIIMEILYHKIRGPGSSKGVILDGFPRTVNQLNMFTQVFPIHLVINIEHSYEYLMASILGRRTCMCCGTSYSAQSYYKDGYELDVIMPREEGVCDDCGGSVETRPDDKEDILKKRLEEYEAKTFPLLGKLNQEGVLMAFEAKRGVRDYPKLQQLIVSRVGLPYFYHQFRTPDTNISLYYD